MKIAVIEGPLLDKIGSREPSVYGGFSRQEMVTNIQEEARKLETELVFFSSYIEGEIAKAIAECDADGIIINPGAYTHTSILLRDALLYFGKPFVETHISNIFSREPFRKKSYIRDISSGFVSGFGKETYAVALKGLVSILEKSVPDTVKT